MKFREFIKSKTFRLGAAAFGGVILLAVVFAAGVFVGLDKARFSYSWGENYLRNFSGRGKFISDKDYMDAHGSSGQVLTVDGPNVTIRNRAGTEVNIATDSQTILRNVRMQIPLSDLKVNDFIAVIGSPNSSGQIQAKLIRILPEAMFPPPPPMNPPMQPAPVPQSSRN